MSFTEPALLQTALHGIRDNAFAVLRYDAFVKRLGADPMPFM
jgi:two-component system nitrogen regulation sensor histidine kinase GlnL